MTGRPSELAYLFHFFHFSTSSTYLSFVVVVRGIVRIVLSGRRDIVDVHRAVIVQIIDRVNPAAAALLDRTAWLVLLRRALLAAKPLGRRGRAEVGAAITTARTHGTASRARSSKSATARTRPSESTAWTWPAKSAAWPRSAEPATTRARSESLPGRPRWPILAGARFADREIAPLERLRIETLDDFLGLRAVDKLNEGEATGTPGFPIDRHHDVGGFGDSCEVSAKVGFARPVGQVPDEQTDSQDFLVSGGRLRF